MSKRIDAIFFDIGGTLRKTTQKKDEKRRLQGASQIRDLLGVDQPLNEFSDLLAKRARAYKDWAEQTMVELSEEEMWTQWMLPDWPKRYVYALAPQLNMIWHNVTGIRTIPPETRPVLEELFCRGYRLGLISNTTSRSDAMLSLQRAGIYDYFDAIMLSMKFGRRKPDISIFLAAAESMLVKPENCAYVGDRPDRDVAGSRKAGFSKAIIVQDPLKPPPPAGDPLLSPDHLVDSLIELLDIFPARYRIETGKERGPRVSAAAPAKQPAIVYDASLSSMWGIGKFARFADFLSQAELLGFRKIELNHQVDSAMLEGVDLGCYQFSSIHEPCPADISVPALKERDWFISSIDEECRQHGVRMVKRSINLACDLGAKAVVIHAGVVDPDTKLEGQMRRLLEAGQANGFEYRELKQKLMDIKANQIGSHLEAVKKSLRELLDYAERYKIRLGLENRYHYLDIPGLDEMEGLLGLAGPEQLGFIYDTGHAQALDRLGFYAHEDWLKCYASRMIGVHLHDVIGVNDHFAPGTGEVDFEMVARYLPKDAFRTLELRSSVSPEQVKAGMEFLAAKGCIACLAPRD